MIRKTVEIDLTGEYYAVQNIQIDSAGGINVNPIVAKNYYAEADNYIKDKIVQLQIMYGKDNVIFSFDPVKKRYTVKVSYDAEVAKGSFIVIYAITKLYL